MPRRSSRSQSVVVDDVSLEEQQLALARIEQERADRELAERLYQEQFDTPPSRGGTSRGRGRGSRRQATSTPSNPVRRRQSTGAARGRRGASRAENRGRRRAEDTGGVGPIATARRAPSVEVISPIGRRRSRRTAAARGRGTLRFNGDRLEALHGNEVIDVTDNAHFPSDDEDSDYDGSRDPEPEPIDDDDNGDDDVEVGELQFQGQLLSNNQPVRMNLPRGRRNARQQFENMINEILRSHQRDNNRLFVTPGLREDGTQVLVGAMVLTDSEDDDDDGFGMRPERNHIHQPIFEEDREMFDRELELFRDDDETTVPPPKVSMRKGKPIEPDSTWGDCVICSAPPVQPKGCTKCLQFIGCTDCINRWHAARKPTSEGSSCPLCRASWPYRGPYVSLMPTIEKKRAAEQKKTIRASPHAPSSSGPSSSEPSTSSSDPSTSSSCPSTSISTSATAGSSSSD